MKTPFKFLSRHHLDAYSEMVFSDLLIRKGYEVYFPFKDVGIDIITTKNRKIKYYQLKSRNPLKDNVTYWFPVRRSISKIKSLNYNLKQVHFVFCALQLNQKEFHFFEVPFKRVLAYFNKKRGKLKRDFEIRRIKEDKYETLPYYIKFNINKYRFK